MSHAAVVTWTTEMDPSIWEGPGPDLATPCVVCGQPVQEHDRLSLTPANTHRPLGEPA